MFGSLGMPELIVIMVIALLVFGPKKLPEVGRSIGKALREFKKTTEDIKGKFEEQINAEEFKDIKNDIKDIKSNLSEQINVEEFKGIQNDIKDIKKDLTEDGEGKKIS